MNSVEKCIFELTKLAEKQGYLLYDDIINKSDSYGFSISELDNVSEILKLKGIIFYEDKPEKTVKEIENHKKEYDDYSHIDYNKVYNDIVSIDPDLVDLVERIKSIKPPQYGELAVLTAQSRNGNQHAKERLINSHLRIAIKIALNMSKSYKLDLKDAISASFLGLNTAAERFDPNGFSTFQGYAGMYIQQSIQRECRPIWMDFYFPVHVREKMIPLFNDYNSYDKTLYSDEEIFERISKKRNIPTKKVKYYINLAIKQTNKISFESIKNDDNYVASRKAFYYVDNQIEENELKKAIKNTLSMLTEREADVISLRFGLNDGNSKTLEEIGNAYGLTRERIRQIEIKGKRKLFSCKDKLKEFKNFDFEIRHTCLLNTFKPDYSDFEQFDENEQNQNLCSLDIPEYILDILSSIGVTSTFQLEELKPDRIRKIPGVSISAKHYIITLVEKSKKRKSSVSVKSTEAESHSSFFQNDGDELSKDILFTNIVEFLKKDKNGVKAKKMAKEFGVDTRRVNSILYKNINKVFEIDDQHHWYLKQSMD